MVELAFIVIIAAVGTSSLAMSFHPLSELVGAVRSNDYAWATECAAFFVMFASIAAACGVTAYVLWSGGVS